MNNSTNQSSETVTTVKLKPQIGGWLFTYIVLSLPGFVLSTITLIVIILIVIGSMAAVNSAEKSSKQANSTDLEYEYIDGNKNSNNKILVYDLKGTIYSGGDGATLQDLQSNMYVNKIQSDFKKIKDDNSVKAVIYKMNTPGGEVLAAEEIGDAVNDLNLNKNQTKPVFYWDSIVASGGVYITAKTTNNYVIANPYGESGSIGVITKIPDLQGLYDKIGVKWRVYKSAPNKDYGSEARNPTEDENKFIQSQIDKTFNRFVDLVSSGRKIERNKVLEFANGFIFQNDESQKLGLVDELGPISNAYNKVAEQAKLNNNDYQIVTIKKKSDFIQELFSPSAKTNLVGALLGVDTSSLNKQNKLTGTTYLFDPRYLE